MEIWGITKAARDKYFLPIMIVISLLIVLVIVIDFYT